MLKKETPRKMLNRRSKQISNFVKTLDNIDLDFSAEDFEILVEAEKQCQSIKNSTGE